MLPDFTIALVGRPNVGKSTLFNRLVGKNLALVDDRPGVTRDRRMGQGRLGDLRFTVIDTAGLEQEKPDSLQARMRAQTEIAMQQADLILMLVDGRAGLLPDDTFFARLIRKSGVPTYVLVNKAEGGAGAPTQAEAYGLGLGAPVAFSAEHGDGTHMLYAYIRDAMAEHASNAHNGADIEDDDAQKPLRVAIIGRPNAGKSTLINRLVEEDRVLTGPEAGVTRDSIGIAWQWRDKTGMAHNIMLWDTAGMRKRARIQDKLEKLSVADGLRAIEFAEVIVLLIDASRPFDKQDIQLAAHAANEGRALVIAVNKWDLQLERAQIRDLIAEKLEFALSHIEGVPVVFVSALTGQGIDRLMPMVLKQYDLWNMRISTAKLNKWLEAAVTHHPPPTDNGRAVRLRYVTQAKARPPSFVLFSPRAHAVPASYQRYLLNNLRTYFNLPGIPLRLFLRKGKNPYI